MLVAARDAGVRRVVYAGSSSAYGDTPTLPKHEDMPTNPLSPYALQKLDRRAVPADVHAPLRSRDGDHPLLQRVRPAPGSGLAVLRRHLAVPAGADRGQAPTIHGDGEQTRDFTYVANVVDGVLRAAEAPAAGEVINVATGSRVSLNELFAVLKTLTGNRRSRRYEPARAGDVRDSQADITKAQRLLGYPPTCRSTKGSDTRSPGLRRSPAPDPSASSTRPTHGIAHRIAPSRCC